MRCQEGGGGGEGDEFRDWERERAAHSCSLQPRGSAT